MLFRNPEEHCGRGLRFVLQPALMDFARTYEYVWIDPAYPDDGGEALSRPEEIVAGECERDARARPLNHPKE